VGPLLKYMFVYRNCYNGNTVKLVTAKDLVVC